MCIVVWILKDKIEYHKAFTCAMLSQEKQGNIEQDFSLCIVVLSVKDISGQVFYLCNSVLRVPRVFSLKDNIAQSISIKKTLNKTFPVPCCLHPLRQHCTRFLPVLCCPKSIKTTLIRIFSCAMLSGDSWTTFTKFLPV